MEMKTRVIKVMDMEFNDISSTYKKIINKNGCLKSVIEEGKPMILFYENGYITTNIVEFVDEDRYTADVYTKTLIYTLEKIG